MTSSGEHRETPMQLVELRLAPRAREFIELWGTTEEVVLAQVRTELTHDVDTDFAENFIFHIITVPGENRERSLSCRPIQGEEATHVLVEVVTYESVIMDRGPFKGREILIPVVGEDDDEATLPR